MALRPSMQSHKRVFFLNPDLFFFLLRWVVHISHFYFEMLTLDGECLISAAIPWHSTPIIPHRMGFSCVVELFGGKIPILLSIVNASV